MKVKKAKIDKGYLEKIKSLSFNTGAQPPKPKVKGFAFAAVVRIPIGKGKRNEEEAFPA